MLLRNSYVSIPRRFIKTMILIHNILRNISKYHDKFKAISPSENLHTAVTILSCGLETVNKISGKINHSVIKPNQQKHLFGFIVKMQQWHTSIHHVTFKVLLRLVTTLNTFVNISRGNVFRPLNLLNLFNICTHSGIILPNLLSHLPSKLSIYQ